MTMPAQKPGRSKQDYGTPDAFLEAVLRLLGARSFHYDLACDATNKITQARRGLIYPTTDALSVPWGFAGWNWLNPPFANIWPWAHKCLDEWIRHETHTALLIPASVGTEYWAAFIHDQAHVFFPRPRLSFKGTTDPYPKDLALVVYGHEPAYDTWKWNE